MKKTVISINLGNFGSTGTIMRNISAFAEGKGYQCYCAYPGNASNKEPSPRDILICSPFVRKATEKLAYYTGYRGCWLPLHTLALLYKIKKLNPGIVHLHNLHDTYLNLPILFAFLRRENYKVIWTLHDCWPFTGQCPHFTMVNCEKWKSGCFDCPQYHLYPSARVDKTYKMWQLKRKWFAGLKDLTLVTPSLWLAELVGKSFLKDYPVKVIHNGIDLSVFQPRQSAFRQKHGISDGQFMLLAVAFDWGKRKGLDVFVELSKRLDPLIYRIVLVGTGDSVDKLLPKNIISIHRTQNQKELAEIYSAADLFINPTREEVLGMVNIEANACGTPVITFRTGGSPECIDDTSGTVVDCDDVNALEREIISMCESSPYSEEKCVSRANRFRNDVMCAQYIDLYGESC